MHDKIDNSNLSVPRFFNPISQPKAPIELNFDEPMQLKLEEIGKLYIDYDGFSHFYPGSYFEYKILENGTYLVTRRKWEPKSEKLNIPLLDNSGFIEIANFSKLLQLEKNNTAFPPIYSTEKFPEEKLIGSGNMGQVHLVAQGETPRALKLDRLMHTEVKQGRRFTLDPNKSSSNCILIGSLTDQEMHRSFMNCYNEWSAIKDIPESNNIAAVKGLVFVKDLNQWGLMFDYVEGCHFEHYCKELSQGNPHEYTKILNLSIQLVEGLKILDEAGHVHTDLLEPNILIRSSDSNPVLIDYSSSTKTKNNVSSRESRQQFGKRLSQLVKDRDIKELNQLVQDCESNVAFEDLSWDMILTCLNQLKELSLEENKSNVFAI